MAASLQFVGFNVHQYMLKLYVKDTYHNDLKTPELTTPRNMYICINVSF